MSHAHYTESPETDLLQDEAVSVYVDDQGRKVHVLTEDKFIEKIILKHVEDGKRADVLGRVWMTVTGTDKNDKVVLDYPHEWYDFVLGKAKAPRGLEMAVATMKVGDEAIIRVLDKSYGWSDLQRPEGVDPETSYPIEFKVKLQHSEKYGNAWEMYSSKRFELAQSFKAQGNDHFAAKRFRTAIKVYDQAILYSENLDEKTISAEKHMNSSLDRTRSSYVPSKTELGKISDEFRRQVWLNMALCSLSLGSAEDLNAAEEKCTLVLNSCPANPKALLRRGRARRRKGDVEGARKDLERGLGCVEQDGNIKTMLKKEWRLLENVEVELKEKQKRMYDGFLNRKPKKKPIDPKTLKRDCCSRLLSKIYASVPLFTSLKAKEE